MSPTLDRLEALLKAATQGDWWFDSYNTAFCGKGESAVEIFQIPDHPQDGQFEPNQIQERGSWYRESQVNAELSIQSHNRLPTLLRVARAAEKVAEEGWGTHGTERGHFVRMQKMDELRAAVKALVALDAEGKDA